MAEHGRLESVRFGDLRRLAIALDVRFEGLVRWSGGDLDRMMNRGHAHLHEAMARWMRDLEGWSATPEVSFSRFGERGVMDVLAWHPASRIILVIELKTELVDVNDLMATIDIRCRIAWDLARERGWRPAAVACWVVVAPGRTNARVLADHATVLRAKFPADGRSMRGWIRQPHGEIAGLSFMPQARLDVLGRPQPSSRRVRRHPGSMPSASSSSPLQARRPLRPRIGVAFRE